MALPTTIPTLNATAGPAQALLQPTSAPVSTSSVSYTSAAGGGGGGGSGPNATYVIVGAAGGAALVVLLIVAAVVRRSYWWKHVRLMPSAFALTRAASGARNTAAGRDGKRSATAGAPLDRVPSTRRPSATAVHALHALGAPSHSSHVSRSAASSRKVAWHEHEHGHWDEGGDDVWLQPPRP